MTYFDRFFIASLISPTAVGAYSIAYELSSKLNIIAAALSTALAPFFAKQKNQPNLITQTFILSSITITSIFIPLIGCISAYGDLLLHWWLKQDEIKIIHQTTQWLALGFFFNAIALIFYTHLQFMERPDITAKIHLIELPFYLGLLIILLIHQGVIGAAIAWTIRAAIDMLLLLIYSLRVNRNHITCAISI
jgi:O-antigen/teichoic acid export membrane protein